MNRVLLVGTLGADPEITHTGSGTAVANLRVATDAMVKQERKTEWHRCVVFDKGAEYAARSLHKGDKVEIDGRLQTREWTDKDGVKRQTTEIVGQVNLIPTGRNKNGEPAATGSADDGDDSPPF